jgi:hypothetical protein
LLLLLQKKEATRGVCSHNELVGEKRRRTE